MVDVDEVQLEKAYVQIENDFKVFATDEDEVPRNPSYVEALTHP